MTAAPAGTRDPNVQPCAKQPPKIPVTIRISMFFDGTGNNRTNTGAYDSWERTRQGDAPGDPSGSYGADYTNVVKLDETVARTQPGYDEARKVYVEGIGTEDLESDSSIGYGTGTGATGIEDRVTQGMDEAIGHVRDIVAAKGGAARVTVTRLHFDSLGFSRGAAAARHFVHRAIRQNQVKRQLTAAGIAVGDCRVRFCGLFDTVPSHGTDVGDERIDDVGDLGLDAVRVAEKVTHLAAADEHRKNFSLVNIASARGNGREIFLPGAHSDIGGSYNPTENELGWEVFDIDPAFTAAVHIRRMAAERAWLIEQGWYTAAELRPPNRHCEIIADRRGISNRYARIPLQIMGRHAAPTQLRFTGLPTRYAVTGAFLQAVAQRVEAINAGNPSAFFSGARGRQASGMMQQLRHDYLHFSARYGERWRAHVPRWTGGSAMDGVRERKIHDG